MNAVRQTMAKTKEPVLYDTSNSYQIFNVYGCDRGPLHEQIKAMWARNGALPAGADPDKRLSQVVMAAVNGDKVVAVNTVYDTTLAEMGVDGASGQLFHAYRMFVEPGETVMWLPITMTCGAFDVLQELNHEKRYTGMLIRVDNPKVAQPSSLAQFARQGWPVYALDKEKRIVMRRDFGKKNGEKA